ncbi:MAG: DUF1593 domain-containing protein [Planctomycetaceae bacterium]|nr:DUF1593 domain-containing protein [Planctomycetaceae bacterium]
MILRSGCLRLLLMLLSLANRVGAGELDDGRLRLIIETDAGGDPDDEQSLVRFLLYANEFDIEAIIANRPETRDGENLSPERTGPGVVRRLIEAYCECWPKLVQHDPRYPSPEIMRSRTIDGTQGSLAGVQAIIDAVDADDPRPVWYADWGSDDGSSINNLLRALDVVLQQRGPDGYARFKSRILLSSNNAFGPHARDIAPPFPFWVEPFEPEIDRKRWYHRFSAVTETAGGFDLERDVRTGHGPLGALYPTNTTHRQKEGDTMTFLYLVPTGMNHPLQPGWGSWAGRYGRPDDPDAIPDYFWANQYDEWNGSSSRENTIARFAADLQNDFRARLDWCVRPPAEANHPPVLPLRSPRVMDVSPGSAIVLDASETSDPDGDSLTFHWWTYREPGTYTEPPAIADANTPVARLTAPADAGELHVVLTVTDGGDPPFSRYSRFVLRVQR